MPNIGVFHPQVVHFAIALLALGVAFRWVSLTGRAAFTGPAAATLLLLGTVSAVVAVKSGDDAHSPVERVPGARPAVVEHEEWGERTRNLFLAVAALELLALGADRLRIARFRKALLVASAGVGLGGGFALYEAAEHGGELVYGYAGGVGIRSGDTADVSRLLLAGLYHSAVQARAQGRPDDAAALFDDLAGRFPGDTNARLLAIESLVQDRKDGRAALQALAAMSIAPDDARLRVRHGLLRVDAFVALGLADSARATLERLAAEFPANARVRDRLTSLP